MQKPTRKSRKDRGGTGADIKYLQYAKYAIFLSCLLVSSFNLIDALSQGESVQSILYFSGLVFIFSVVIVIIPGKIVMICILTLTGMLTLVAQPNPLDLCGGVAPIIIANGMIKNTYVKLSIYFAFIIIVMYKHIMDFESVTSVSNSIVVYITLFYMAEMVYNYIRGCDAGQQK